MEKHAVVYILSNKRNGTLYVGVTSDLVKRIYQHKNKLVDGFSKKYNCDILVYYEQCEDMRGAIEREKQIKGMPRIKKITLIENSNIGWEDLYEGLL